MARMSHPLSLCVAAVLVLAAVRLAVSPRNVASSTPVGGATYAAGKADLDAQLRGAEVLMARRPDSWMAIERVANMHLNRGRYCDDWKDYAIADSLMAHAFAIAPAGTGPFLGRARLNFTMHRFDRVDVDLVRAERQLLLSPRTQSEIDALRADAALEQGRSDAALAAYRRAVDAQRNFDSLARLAGGLVKTGALEEADAVYAEASAALPHSATRERAWVNLQRGLVALDAHDLDTALHHYREAKAQFPGWWLADEHIAEALYLQGHRDQAFAIYEDVLARTGDPEFMDMIARIYRDRGDLVTAHAWVVRANQGHALRLARFPEAAAGHAKQHVKDFGAI